MCNIGLALWLGKRPVFQKPADLKITTSCLLANWQYQPKCDQMVNIIGCYNNMWNIIHKIVQIFDSPEWHEKLNGFENLILFKWNDFDIYALKEGPAQDLINYHARAFDEVCVFPYNLRYYSHIENYARSGRMGPSKYSKKSIHERLKEMSKITIDHSTCYSDNYSGLNLTEENETYFIKLFDTNQDIFNKEMNREEYKKNIQELANNSGENIKLRYKNNMLESKVLELEEHILRLRCSPDPGDMYLESKKQFEDNINSDHDI